MQSFTPPWLVSKYPQFAKIAVWIGFFLLIYLMRSFFLLIFLTFVFAFLQYRLSEKLKTRLRNYRARTWLIGIVFFLAISGSIYFLTTQVKHQITAFLDNFNHYIVAVDNQINSLGESFPIVEQMLIDFEHSSASEGQATKSPTLLILRQVFDVPSAENGESIKKSLSKIFLYSGKIIGISSSFLLSLLFSFLIILDYPRLAHSLSKLEKSRVSFIVQEVKPGIMQFARTLGKAFEAQFFIAVMNTLLTGIGLWILGIGKYSAFLLATVFLCSFIPIAGVFISSVPICMMALQGSGLSGIVMAICMITIIHMIEAYILNPRIYGSHMRINPVLVLGILTISGKLFGLWGLLLSVPICTWFARDVCLRQSEVTSDGGVK
ncbi:MAG: AI-2E family transporter [Fibromonadales bacterium]|nr:AI-2E family transporter [Fibromonadales bacterium]